ncbi:MAG: toprim domain-containing protein, partial [Janthinobacterium lividum]
DGATRLVPGGRKELVQAAAALAVERIQANAADPKWSLTISAPTNSDARAISAAMRPAKRAAGTLGPDQITVKATDQKGAEEFDLPLAVGDKVRFYRTTHATYETGHKRIFAANGGTADVTRIDPERGVFMRNRSGKVAFAAWADLSHEATGRVQLSYGDAMTIDAIQGATSREHINALPSGSAASHSFRNYPAQSRSIDTTYLMVSQGIEKTEVMEQRALGNSRPISNDDIWNNVARNLARQPDKELATELLQRANEVFYGTVRGFAASSHNRQRRQARGEPPTTAAARTQEAHEERDIAAAAPAMGEAIRQQTDAANRIVGLLTGPTPPKPIEPRQIRRATRPAASRPKEPTRMHVSPVEAENQFRDEMHLYGLRPRGALQMDGRWHRVQVEGDKKGVKSGSYVGYLDGRPAGFLHNFKTGEKRPWKANGEARPISAEERDAERAQMAVDKARREAEQAAFTAAAARKAGGMWAKGKRVQVHPYLKKKGVQAHGLRQDRYGNLLVPMRDAAGDLHNVQTISGDGRTKLFVKDGRKQGTFAMLGALEPGAPVVIAEGFATGATVRELTGYATAIAFDAGNLMAVAQAIRAANPNQQIIFAADNDEQLPRRVVKHPEGLIGPPVPLRNVGLEKATAAAEAVNGIVVTPAPAYGHAEDKGTDWNDHKAERGEEATRAALSGLLMQQGIIMANPTEVAAALARPAVSQEQRDAARTTTATAAQGAQTGTAQAQAQAQSQRQQQAPSTSSEL